MSNFFVCLVVWGFLGFVFLVWFLLLLLLVLTLFLFFERLDSANLKQYAVYFLQTSILVYVKKLGSFEFGKRPDMNRVLSLFV